MWNNYGSVKYTNGSQTGATAEVNPTVIAQNPGNYNISVDWLLGTTQTTGAIYTIVDNGSTIFASDRINQQKKADGSSGSNGDDSGYLLLGSFSLTGINTKIILSGESDDDGNVVFDTVKITHANVALSTPVLTSPTNGSFTNSVTNISLNWTASVDTDEAPALPVQYDVYVDGTTLADSTDLSTTNYSLDVSGMTQGAHNWQVFADNSEGSVTQSAIGNFSIDTNAPVVTGVSLGQTYNDARTITVTDANLEAITLNGNSFTSGTTISANGSYTLITTDKAGNTTTVNFIIDIAPQISNETASDPSTTSTTITWTTDQLSTSRVVYDTVSHPTKGLAPNYSYAFSTDEYPGLVTSHSVAITGLTPGTTYYYRTVSHGSPEATGLEFSFTTQASKVVKAVATVEPAVTQPTTPQNIVQEPVETVTPVPTEQGEIKGTETEDSGDSEDINWTPWIILFILIILAGAATGGYFYWFGKDDEEEIVSSEVVEKSRKPAKNGKAKKASSTKKNRW